MTIQFVMTVAGTFPLLAFFILERIYGESLKAKTYIWILRASIILYLIPFQRVKFFVPGDMLKYFDRGLEIRDFILSKTEYKYLQIFVEDTMSYQIPMISAITLAFCFVIFLIILGKRIYNYLQIQRLLAYNADEIPWEEEATSALFQKGRRKRIRLYESQEVLTPCTTGIFHPYIVIPEDAYEEREKEWAIRHEMGHILHRDILWKFLCMVCCALHWYNIFSYVLLYEYSCFSEYYCDEFCMAERSKKEKQGYGIFIVEEATSDHGLFHTLQELTFGGKNMKKRMRWLLGEKKKGVLVPIMMAAALFMSSMTVFAYSSYRETELPIENGMYVLGMDYAEDNEYVLSMEENGEASIGDIDFVDFCGASRVFQEEGSDEFIPLDEDNSSYLLCLHEWVHGYIYLHKDLSGGRCQVLKYEGDVCKKCQSDRNMVYISTTTFANCPH